MSDNEGLNNTKQFVPHPPIDEKVLDKKVCFSSTRPDFKMHRPDGKEINFNNNYFETDNSADAEYLDTEIVKHRNANIRRASDDEIRLARMRVDPKGTIEQELLDDPEAMARLQKAWEAKQRGDSGAGIQGVDGKENTGTVTHSDGARIFTPNQGSVSQKLAGENAKEHPDPASSLKPAPVPETAAQKKIRELREGKHVPTGDLGDSTEQKLHPVSTSDLGGGAEGSTSGQETGI